MKIQGERLIPMLFALVSGLIPFHLTAASRCDVNNDGVVNVLDIQQETNEAIGAALAVHDLNNDGVVNVLDVQIVVTAVTKGVCTQPPTSGSWTVHVGNTGGTVEVSGQKSCSSTGEPVDCTYTLPIETTVSISFVPQPGFFAYTNGNLGGQCGPTVTIGAAPTACSVTFLANPVPHGTLTVTASGVVGGVAVSGGAPCIGGPAGQAHNCTYSFSIGTVVKVTTTPLPTHYSQGNCPSQVTIGSTPQSCYEAFY